MKNNLGIIISYGKDQIDRKKFSKIKNSRYPYCKPENGGLWTSPEKSTWGWKDFCISESIRNEEHLQKYIKFRLKESARLYKIDSLQDLHKIPFLERKKYVSNYYKWYINYEKLSEMYDGIWLTPKGQSDTRCSEFDYKLNEGADLYGWDLETILLFNLDCIQKTKIYGLEQIKKNKILVNSIESLSGLRFTETKWNRNSTGEN